MKLRLLSKQAYSTCINLFKSKLAQSTFIGTEWQENTFLDGPTREFESQRRTIRLRKATRFQADTNTTQPHSVITLKGNGKLVDGVSRIEELEEGIDEETLELLLKDPKRIREFVAKYPLLDKVVKEHPKPDELRIIGRFKNCRNIFKWNELKIEVDETSYSFGDAYEIEIETEEPQKAHDLM